MSRQGNALNTELKPAECKRIVAEFLSQHDVPHDKLTARTIDFTDLARVKTVFVKIHGWQPNPIIADLQSLARSHDFCVETDWFVS